MNDDGRPRGMVRRATTDAVREGWDERDDTEDPDPKLGPDATLSEGLFACPVCSSDSEVFSELEAWADHMEQRHGVEGPL